MGKQRANDRTEASTVPAVQAKNEVGKKLASKRRNKLTVKSVFRKRIQFGTRSAFSIFVVSVIILFGSLVYYRYTTPTPVNTCLNVPRSVASDWRNRTVYSERLWGTYRSNVYFGIRPRLPKSLLFGMMWFVYDTYGMTNLHHTCEHDNNMQRYNWLRHDGSSFGQQEIIGNGISLKTDFITADQGNVWTARIRADSQSSNSIRASFIFYVYNEGDGEMGFVTSEKNVAQVEGHTPDFRKFKMKLNNKYQLNEAVYNFMSANLPSITNLTNVIKSKMKLDYSQNAAGWPAIHQLPGEKANLPNFLAYQVTVLLPFEIDIVFENGTAVGLSDHRFTTELENKIKCFDKKFMESFKLMSKGFGESEINFAKAALSNLIGGIGYFYGSSKVTSKDYKTPVDYWPAPLYTAVPSRSFFPRGFLWDEGFHQILVAHWDISIVKDVIAHWLDLMNHEGWIPREQILGEVAREKVPPEFIVQHNENANPPTFFLTLEVLIQEMQQKDELDIVFLKKIFPRLKTWFVWFNKTQIGEKPFTYRWRGRNNTTDRELNPKTLTSGLDDFPRASHPTTDEYHVDLRCWMALASRVIVQISEVLGENPTEYSATYDILSDQMLLDELHWNAKRKIYSDYGLHTPAVKLQEGKHHTYNFKWRKVSRDPVLRHVNSFGYVNLFPFFLKLVSPHSEKLNFILNRMRNESLLWSNYGLRSLSKSDSLYNKANTEDDPPYWRGTVWINMNYLACRALHYYSNVEGPYQHKAQQIYDELRSNLIYNMHTQYVRTGYIWEQYDDDIGSGKGIHPFTGWSSLIVLIMAEKY